MKAGLHFQVEDIALTFRLPKMNRFFYFLSRGFLSIMSLYLIGFGIIYFLQERIIFQSSSLAPDAPFSYDAKELTIPSTDGVKLNALLFKAADSTRGLILYFHGNRHSLQQWGWNASFLTHLGYDVLMIDYRGYGKSNGVSGEKGLYDDALSTLAWAEGHYLKNTPFIYYGRSLGSGVATYLATQHMPARLVLETPYDELKNVVPWYLRYMLDIIPLRHQFKNNERLPLITCPILIMHGTEDIIVPLSSALGLKPLLKPKDKFLIVEGGKHYNLNKYEEARNAVQDFLQ